MEITITREEFRKLLNEANKRFLEIVEGDSNTDPMASFVMGLQNLTFGTVLETTLFGKEE